MRVWRVSPVSAHAGAPKHPRNGEVPCETKGMPYGAGQPGQVGNRSQMFQVLDWNWRQAGGKGA